MKLLKLVSRTGAYATLSGGRRSRGERNTGIQVEASSLELCQCRTCVGTVDWDCNTADLAGREHLYSPHKRTQTMTMHRRQGVNIPYLFRGYAIRKNKPSPPAKSTFIPKGRIADGMGSEHYQAGLRKKVRKMTLRSRHRDRRSPLIRTATDRETHINGGRHDTEPGIAR